MLIINIPAKEYWVEEKEEFINIPEYTLHLEHSLVSISKWEAEWEKPFLNDKEERTEDETLSYIKYMTFEQNIPDVVFKNLSNENRIKINNYIEKKMTATWFREEPVNSTYKRREIITSEVIYYWMVELNIPVEFQKWHINRLLTLIKVCNEKHKEASGENKMSKSQLMSRNRALNMARRKSLRTKG